MSFQSGIKEKKEPDTEAKHSRECIAAFRKVRIYEYAGFEVSQTSSAASTKEDATESNENEVEMRTKEEATGSKHTSVESSTMETATGSKEKNVEPSANEEATGSKEIEVKQKRFDGYGGGRHSGPRLNGWWKCCECRREVNTGLFGSSCPDCSHEKCSWNCSNL